MPESRKDPSYIPSSWRYGPLHCVNGEVLIGDPLGNHAVVTVTGLLYRDNGQEKEAIEWEEISAIQLSCPSTKFRLVARLFDMATLVTTALSGQAETPRAYDSGTLQIKTRGGLDSTWRIDSMETGKYWFPHIELAQLFLQTLSTNGSFRVIVRTPDVAETWCESVLSA